MKEKKLMKLMKQRKVFQMNMMRVIPRRNSRNAKRKNKLKSEYDNCEKELRNKTEEAEMLRCELKDLKEIIKLQKLLEDENEDTPTNEEKKKSDSSEEEILLQMKKSGFQRKSPQSEARKTPQPKGKNTLARESEFNCRECDFQATKEIELNKHMNLKHRIPGNVINGTIKCRNCVEQFTSKWNLMTHRKYIHLQTVAMCRNKLEGKCDYSDEMCWWNHNDNKSNSAPTNCYVCSEVF